MAFSTIRGQRAETALRDAKILRRDGAGYLARGRCRYATALDAAYEIGKATAAAVGSGRTDLLPEIRAEWRRIRNLNSAFERRCGKPDAFRSYL